MKDNRPVTAVANELGIHINTLYKWIRQVSEYQDDAFPGSDNLRPEDEELRKLKRKIADLKRKTLS